MASYYAVIFTSVLKLQPSGYAEMAEKMAQLAKLQPGYMDIESARDDSLGITVSYWKDEASIKAWRDQVDHSIARKLGKKKWYLYFRVRVCKVERDYEFGEQS